MVDSLVENSKIDWVVGNTYVIDVESNEISLKFTKRNPNFFGNFLESNYFSMVGSIIKKEVFEYYGVFDENETMSHI